jgi:phosphodiesterase/alkaline phosphatase D-like protein
MSHLMNKAGWIVAGVLALRVRREHAMLGRMHRILLIVGLFSLVMLAGGVLGLDRASADPSSFSLGVASGDVTSSSALLWAHADQTGSVTAQVDDNSDFSSLADSIATSADSARDNTVHATTTALSSNTLYYYRFEGDPGVFSDVGTFKTAPSSSANQTVRFGWSGDADATDDPMNPGNPAFGTYNAYGQMAAEGNDFNIILGDTIYSDSEVPGSPLAVTRSEKWDHYRLGLGQSNLVNLREAAGVYSQWDDHEFRNDFSVAEFGSTIYKDGKDAFIDYAPVADPNVSDPPNQNTDTGGYHTYRWGANLELFVLDERSFRSAKASNDPGNPGVCDNGGSPDLGPTAPQSPTRDTFAAIVPSLANPSPPGCVAEINSTSRTFLGATQLAQFKSDIAASNATFKVVINETPIQQFYALPYDRWEGYAAERTDLLTYLNNMQDAANVVFLTTDTHANLINVVRFNTLPPDPVSNSKMKEIVTGPVATNPFGVELNATVGNAGADWLVRDLFFMPAPTAAPPLLGMGMDCAQLNTRSYGEVQVDRYHLTINLKDENGNALTQNFHDMASYPCGPVDIQAESDGDGCPDVKEQQTAVGSQTSGGLRDYLNPWDYFNPEKIQTPHTQTVADILRVIRQYGKNDTDGNPGLPPYTPGYTPDTDRTNIPGGYPWSLGPPNGTQTVADILAAIRQYSHNCS